jgi:hypothetical protein
MTNPTRHMLTIGAVFFFLVFYGCSRWKSTQAIDFYQFWIVGQAVKTMPVSNIYDKSQQRLIAEAFLIKSETNSSSTHQTSAAKKRSTSLELIGTPLLYAMFSIISNGDYDSDYNLYRLASIFLYVTAVYIFCYLLGIPLLHTFVAIVFFTNYFWPFKMDVRFGNVDQIQLFMLSTYLLIISKGKSVYFIVAGGLLLSSMVFFKPNLIYVAFFIGFARAVQIPWQKFKFELLGMGLGTLLSFIIPYLIFGNSCTWKSWYDCFPQAGFAYKYAKDSFPALLMGGPDLKIHFYASVILILSTLTPVMIYSYRKKLDHNNIVVSNYLLMGLGICVYILSSPMIHGQYFLLGIPLVLFVIRLLSPSIILTRKERISHYASLAIGAIAILLIIIHPRSSWHQPDDARFHLEKYVGILIFYFLFLTKLIKIHKNNPPFCPEITS